jgi:hypothetical protein
VENALAPGMIAHQVEIYTDLFLITGTATGPFKRTTDLLNRGDRDFISLHGASISPLGQPPNQRVISNAVEVSRKRIHLACELDGPEDPDRASEGRARIRLSSEAHVNKVAHPCYALTGTFIVYGQIHLLADGRLDMLLNRADQFIPITKASIYLAARPTLTWQRDVVIVNTHELTAIYLTG